MNNKSIGLLKSLMKKNCNSKHQTMEINRSNRYSPTKKSKKQIFSISKLNHANFNSNIEKKKNLYQKSLQKLEKNNKHKSIENDNIDINMNFFNKNNILNGNSIPNNYKNNQNSSKTIVNSKNKNFNTSLQKKIGSKSYVDLFQNNIYNSNDYINLGVGRTISNSIYDKIYDFENMNNSNEYNSYIGELNNIINILVNYINIIKKEFEKILDKNIENKNNEILKLKNENKYLLKENKKLKYKIIEMFYCVKNYENNIYNKRGQYSQFIKQLVDENIYLRKYSDKTNNINSSYYFKLENDITNQILQKQLLIQKNNDNEEEKNNKKEDTNIEKEDNIENNPFRFINNNNSNSNNTTSKINHKRQKTQFKLGILPINNENNNKIKEEEKEKDKDKGNKDILNGYINIMNNKILSKDKNSSQKNLLLNKKNKTNDKNKENINNDKDTSSNNENSNLSNSSSTDSVIHNKDNNNKDNNDNDNKDNDNVDKVNTNKILQGLNYSSSFDDKYIKRIEFTK